MTFTTDRTSLTEGEIIEITWDCHEAERVELTIDNGYKATAISLDLTGTKRFRLNRSRGKTKLTLTAWVNGKDYSKTISVRVAEMPVTHAETVDDKGRPVGRLRQWWQTYSQRMRTAYSAMPPHKQLATRLLAIMGGILLLSLAWPRIVYFGFLGLLVYLVVVVNKR